MTRPKSNPDATGRTGLVWSLVGALSASFGVWDLWGIPAVLILWGFICLYIGNAHFRSAKLERAQNDLDQLFEEEEENG